MEDRIRGKEPSITTSADFKQVLRTFINEVLPQIDSSVKTSPQVDDHTPLFESGLIDSLAILQLIGFVEELTGRRIPSRMVVMKHFRTIEAICAAFCPPRKKG